jgi:aldose 1-epimerase
VERDDFGFGRNGEKVERVTIKGGGLTAHVLTWGAIIQDLRLAGHQPPLVLGFQKMSQYLSCSPYFGATPGRCANRIADGRFTLDGQTYQLERNENGMTHLHGGSDGTARSNWTIEDMAADRVTLSILDRDGRSGYPGNCRIRCTYHLKPGSVLGIVYEAVTDKPTLANLCHHSYFNLDGGETALDHELMIAADHYLPTDDRQIPTGEKRPVAGTIYDFRSTKPMRVMAGGEPVRFDHNFCLSDNRVRKRLVAEARSRQSGVSLKVATTEPGVQFYAGYKLKIDVDGLEGRPYPPHAGFCLETQVWPDSIHHGSCPSAILRPGETLRQETDYIFSRA